jgi:hypothetical protein
MMRVFLGCTTKKHPKKFPCYKKYKNIRNILDEKAECQPWIIKKKPKFG